MTRVASTSLKRYYIPYDLRLLSLIVNFCIFNVFCMSDKVNLKPNCTAIKHIFTNRGIEAMDSSTSSLNEMVLRYCELSPNGSCCSYDMETKLARYSRKELENNLKIALEKLSSVLRSRATKFNNFFVQLLLNSKKEFHSMFKRTYGATYEQNAFMFSDLFKELEKYYDVGNIDLSHAMDTFFNTLYKKMFTVLNSQYHFDDKYLECVCDDIKAFKPFGDVQEKLSVQIKRSFVATRTFARAIFTASEVTKKMIHIRLNADCTSALMKMKQCGLCNGYAEEPCNNYCNNVIGECLTHFNGFETEWNNFIIAIEKISERLLGPFNIVMVVEPINIKISEAIMNFQEAGQDITKQVFRRCGRPVLGRRRRSFNSSNKSFVEDDIDIDANLEDEVVFNNRSRDPEDMITINFKNMQPGKAQKVHRSTAVPNHKKIRNKNKLVKSENKNKFSNNEPFLDVLVKEIRQKMRDSKKFWSNLPHEICKNKIRDPEILCWNGKTVERNAVLSERNFHNPEIDKSQANSKALSLISAQSYILKETGIRLRNAYNGQDVTWITRGDAENGIGSGSGSEVDNDDEDMENGSGFKSTTSKSSIRENPSVPMKGLKLIEKTFVNSTNSYKSTQNQNENSSAKSKPVSYQLFIFLFPLYMAWFGGILTFLL